MVHLDRTKQSLREPKNPPPAHFAPGSVQFCGVSAGAVGERGSETH